MRIESELHTFYLFFFFLCTYTKLLLIFLLSVIDRSSVVYNIYCVEAKVRLYAPTPTNANVLSHQPRELVRKLVMC